MTKTSVLLLLAIAGSSVTHAQIKKGAVLLGGQVFYLNSTGNISSGDPGTAYRTAVFNISAGKVIRENSVIGLKGGYGISRTKNATTSAKTFQSDRYNFGVFFRQYKQLAKDFYFFGEADAGYIGLSDKSYDTSGNILQKHTESGGQLSLSPGIAYRLYKKLQVEILMPSLVNAQYTAAKNTLAGMPGARKEDRVQFATSLDGSFLNSLAIGFKFVL